MTTIDRLEAWRAGGIISPAQYATLARLVRRERVSVYLELSALLYLGVLSFVGGIGWTLRAYVADLGDAAIISAMTLIVAAAFYYCFSRAEGYAPHEVPSSNLALEYVLYLGCLMLSAEAGYLEYRFDVFRLWHHHLLLGSVVFGALAYRFDNRFVLSLALSSLAGWLGVGLSTVYVVSSDSLRLTAVIYGVFVAGLGTWLYRIGIKPHFLDAYLHVAVNVALAATASGLGEPSTGLVYLAALVALCTAAIVLGVRNGRFVFVAYGTLYGYAGVSFRLLEYLPGPTAYLLYSCVTGTMVLVGLVVLARRFGREE